MKKTAKFIKNIHGMKGEAKLYKTEGGELPEYVVVSAVVAMFSGAETLIFEANEDGEILNWSDLDGSYRGDLNHEQALENAGYTVK